MNAIAALRNRWLVIYLCAVLLFSLLPVTAAAQTKAQKKVQVQLGKPNVWSIGQAHYLLASMRQVNRGLKTHMPSADELNPSAANATRIQILKTMLNAEVQFSQKDAVGNQAAIRENQISLQNREAAQAALPEKQKELEPLNAELLAINTTIAEKQAKVDRMAAARNLQAHPTATPPVNAPPATKEEDDLAVEVAKLTVAKTDIERRRNDVAAEVASLKSTATGTVGGPTLTQPEFSTAPRPLVGDLSPLISKALDKAANTTPSVAASIALDNYLAMQYEIIAKQMTLLRDEVGPEERVIFLELPTSLYTVPCKADNHMIQLQWQVEEYFEDDDRLADGKSQELRTDFEDIERQKIEELKRIRSKKESIRKLTPSEKEAQATAYGRSEPSSTDDYIYNWKLVRGTETDKKNQKEERLKYSVFGLDANEVTGPEAVQPRRYSVRALDIVPRQSALNVNATYNTVSQVNFLGALKFITGLGIKVDYQRQQELYEQYLQQEVFASGYGKGTDTFGWTFAPLPGTKRVAPGVRTTYAILAIPRKASALQLKVRGITYPKAGAPKQEDGSSQIVAEDTMIVRIPNEFTERFYVKSAEYTSVRKGERVGVLLRGDYFSPQMGVSINGAPLVRALSLTHNETAEATAQAAAIAGVQGSYELLSSHDLYMTFSLADRSIATPTITLVAPEKTSAINFFDLKINYHEGLSSLGDMSKTEPMFVDDFDVNPKFQITPAGSHRVETDKLPAPFIKARLEGKGLRRGADIYIDDRADRLNDLRDVVRRLNQKLIKQKVDAKKAANAALTNEGALEKVKDDLIESYIEAIDAKLKAQNQHLNKRAEERLKALKREQLDDDSELYKALRKVERDAGRSVTEFETPDPSVEYADQDSTGAYTLYFRQPQKTKWTVRYRHNTKQGYEEKVIEVERAVPFAYKVLNYSPPSNRSTATVKLEFSTDNALDNGVTSISIEPAEGTAKGRLEEGPPPRTPDGPRVYSQAFDLAPQDVNGIAMERDQVNVTVKRNGMDDQTVKIPLPLRPAITRIENPNHYDKPWGYVDEEPAVKIIGVNLHHVEHVFFGDKEAKKIGKPGRTEMVIVVPKGEHLTDILTRQTPVRVETDTASGDALSSNVSFFTYVENIAPKKPDKPSRGRRTYFKVLIPTGPEKQPDPK